MQLELFEKGVLINPTKEGKICVYCKILKPFKAYPKHRGHKNRLDTRCKACIKKQAKTRRIILKTAPPKPKLCECCSVDPKKFVMDHCHSTETFRGWLCDHCNLAIGLLGDDIKGVYKAVKYLESS